MRYGGGPEVGPYAIYAHIGGVRQVTPSALCTYMNTVPRRWSSPAGDRANRPGI